MARLAEEGGGKGEAANVKSPIRLAAAFFAVVVAAAVVAIGGSAKTHVAAGGTLRVGWEQSFGFTDTFDSGNSHPKNRVWSLFAAFGM